MSCFDEMNKIKNEFEGVISRMFNHNEENMAVNIIIDDSDPQNPIFVEVENDSGQSLNIGEDSTTDEGYRRLRINTADIINHEKIN